MNDEPINRTNWALLNDYIDSLRNEGIYSEKTLAAMRNALMKFIIYAGMTPITKIEIKISMGIELYPFTIS